MPGEERRDGGAGGAGGAGDLGSLLPFLLLGNGSLDTSTLVLIMMMSQAQPGTVIDDGTGLTVTPASGKFFVLSKFLLS